METVATIGCWSDMKTLRHYVGAEALAAKVMMELKQEDASGRLSDLLQEVLKNIDEWKADAAPPVDEPKEKGDQTPSCTAHT